MTSSSLIFIGIKGSVTALDKTTGAEVWKAKLAGSDFVNLAVEDGSIYATTRGEVFCLSATSGEVRWHNPLKGCGLGLATIGLAAIGLAVDQSAILAEQRRRDQAAATAAASTATMG